MDFQFFFDIFEPKLRLFRPKFFENIPQFSPRGEVICDRRMLHILDLFAAEIYFSMMFTVSLVHARAFVNCQI